MKLRNLLSLGMVVCAGVAVQADPIFTEDFNNRQTKEPTEVAYYEFINQQEGDVWGLKDNALGIKNDEGTTCANQKWQRAIKFRNIPISGGKIYRLTFDLTGSSKYTEMESFNEVDTHVDVKLMQGDENADICILGADGSEQRRDYAPVKDGKYTTMFYYADEYNQRMKYDEQCSGKELYNPDKYFVCVNVYNPGEYSLDNVVLEESNAVEKLEYNGYNIRVTYGNGNNTNIKALAAASTDAKGRVIIDPTYARVKVDGVPVEVETIELQADGYLYIFVKDEIAAGKNVTVTFINPAEEEKHVALQGAWEGADVTFDDMAAEFSEDESLAAAVPFAYAAPELVTSTPENNSFSLPLDISEFTFDFDHVIDESLISAEMSNGESLTKGEVSNDGKSITFTRSGELEKGMYTITLKNVVTKDSGAPADVDPTLTFEVGRVKIARTAYQTGPDYKTQLDGEGGIPTDWTLMVGEAQHMGGAGARGFIYTNSNVQSAFYLRDWDGKAVASRTASLPAGNVEIRNYSAGWGTGGAIKVKFTDAAGTVVAEQEIAVSTALAKDRKGDFQIDPLRIENCPGGDYVCSVELANGSNELLYGGFEVFTYTESDGDKVESKICLDDKTFGSSEDNCAPAVGSGWALYQDGNKREPGANYNYNGTRIFKLGIKNLSTGYYTNGNWNNGNGNYVIFGEGGEGEPMLELPSGNVQFTYYAGNWKTNDRQLYFQVIDENGAVVIDRTDNIHMDPNMNGNRNAGVEAVKVEFTENIPSAGNYKVKFGGDGELFVGNLKIEQPASLAAKWYQKLYAAVDDAQKEIERCAEAKYDGTAKYELAAIIDKYNSPDLNMTTIGQFEAAVQEVIDAQNAMAARRLAFADFEIVRANAAGLVATVENPESGKTHCQALPEYQIVKEYAEKYADVDPSTMADSELVPVTKEFKDNYTVANFMVNTGVALLTNQIAKLATSIVAFDAPSANHQFVIAAGNAISDDQELVKNLKTLFAAKLYAQMAAGDPFTQVDPDLLIETTTPIEATGFIANSNFYCNKPMVGGDLKVEPENFPLWNITVNEGNLTSAFDLGWDPNYPTPEKIISDTGVKTQWTSAEYEVEQTLTALPVARYNFSIQIGEDGNADGHGCYAFCGDEKLAYEGQPGTDGDGNPTVSFSRDLNTEANTKLFEGVYPVVSDGELLGTMSVGAHMMFKGGFGNVDNARLQMVGKVDGFDYAAAAQKLGEEIVAVNEVAQAQKPAGEPVMVNYYDLNGAQVATPQGIVVKVAVWANGYTEVSKETK